MWFQTFCLSFAAFLSSGSLCVVHAFRNSRPPVSFSQSISHNSLAFQSHPPSFSILGAKRSKKNRKSVDIVDEDSPITASINSKIAGTTTESEDGDDVDASELTMTINNGEENLPDSVKAKLKAEIASPFFRVRQYIYISLGMAGVIGALTAVPQVVLSLSNGDDVTSPLGNAAIDIGAVIGGAWLWNLDSSNQNSKVEKFSEKQKQQSNRISSQETRERESTLKLLPVEISASTSNENVTRIVSFGELQEKGKQNVVIFAGDKATVKDAVISCRIQGAELFADKEVIVVPVVMDDDQLEEGTNKGFAAKEGLLSSPYIGKPAQVQRQELNIPILLHYFMCSVLPLLINHFLPHHSLYRAVLSPS